MSPTATRSHDQTTDARVGKIAMKLEVITIPVSDVDRAKEFYGRLGWRLDADFVKGDDRGIQFTPPGSQCSVHFGRNVTSVPPGSAQSLWLIVSDIQAAREDIVGRGIEVSEVFHFAGANRVAPDARVSGPAPDRRSYASFVLTRLVEVLLIEALRSTAGEDAPPGLLRGLADAQLAPAMRQMHGQLARSWTVAQLARTAALSRSAFFERFTRTVGLPPMEYLLAWRMAVAKDLLRRHDFGLAEVAERVGYGSASTFSTAFSRHVGQPPRRHARQASANAAASDGPAEIN
jgi:AraC-like DNA-binding protein/catechol 2,3-dioxygenase-like lactoylglutathione lyase family enzyme